MVDRDDRPAQLSRRTDGLVQPARHELRDHRSQRPGRSRPAASSAATGAKMSRPWKVALGRWIPSDAGRRRRAASRTGVAQPLQHACQQAVVGREEQLPVGLDDRDVPRTADARIDDGDVHSARRKVPEGTAEPEAGLGRPVHQDRVRQVDEPGRRKAPQDLALHHPDERILVAEIRRQRDDAGRLEGATGRGLGHRVCRAKLAGLCPIFTSSATASPISRAITIRSPTSARGSRPGSANIRRARTAVRPRASRHAAAAGVERAN